MNDIQIFQAFTDDYNLKLEKRLGSGGFGTVFEVKAEKMEKTCAAKLLEKKEEFNESDLILEFRGPNIVKVNKIYDKILTNRKPYSLILMEKAPLNDLKSLAFKLKNENILRYVFKNPYEMIGNNFTKFIVKQIVKGFETLFLANFTHFDFKPENTLIFNNIVIKLTDFGLLRNLNKLKNNSNKIKIPGGTIGYFPPEYYYNNDNKITIEEAIKYDYFSLGVTIFYLKYEKKMLKYKIFKDKFITANYMIDLMERAMDEIKTTKSNDKDFIKFLCKLIQFNPKDRLSFEEIYRNKWLNKDWNQILEIVNANQSDEEKMIEELNKSDYLFEKNKYINKRRKEMDKTNINVKDNIEDNGNNNKLKEKHKVNYHKFKLKL
jgi:serine/threonine-protein kinase